MEAATAIYNEGIAERTATFKTEPQSPEVFQRALDEGKHPFVVAEHHGRVVGFAATSADSEFPPYAGVLAFAVYVTRAARRQGVGAELVEGLAEVARERGFYKLIGKIFTSNDASIRLLKRCGFREVGVHHRHGRLEGEWRDVLLAERWLGD